MIGQVQPPRPCPARPASRGGAAFLSIEGSMGGPAHAVGGLTSRCLPSLDETGQAARRPFVGRAHAWICLLSSTIVGGTGGMNYLIPPCPRQTIGRRPNSCDSAGHSINSLDSRLQPAAAGCPQPPPESITPRWARLSWSTSVSVYGPIDGPLAERVQNQDVAIDIVDLGPSLSNTTRPRPPTQVDHNEDRVHGPSSSIFPRRCACTKLHLGSVGRADRQGEPTCYTGCGEMAVVGQPEQ